MLVFNFGKWFPTLSPMSPDDLLGVAALEFSSYFIST